MKTFKFTSLILAIIFLGLYNQDVLSQDPTEDFVNSIMQGDMAAVEKAIDDGMDVNMARNDRTTPLMFAIYGSNLDMVELLISKGADVTLSTEKGGDALNVAAAMGNV
ncbi:MAG: ankyrin repeat domain-containing protein, partial [Bacteroidota bacterium]|nr:ankyrin repeat domain-containing protein [Bacteroidota bacterium]